MLVVSRKAMNQFGDGFFELEGSNYVFCEWDKLQAAFLVDLYDKREPGWELHENRNMFHVYEYLSIYRYDAYILPALLSKTMVVSMWPRGVCVVFCNNPRFDYCFGGKEFAAEGVIVEHEAEIATAEAAASESALQWSRPDKSLETEGVKATPGRSKRCVRVKNLKQFPISESKMQLPLWLVTIFLGFKPSAMFRPGETCRKRNGPW